MNGKLTKSVVLQADLAAGEVLLQAEAGANNSILGRLCYFYRVGKPNQENACAHFRDIEDWETEQVIYTFDYAVEPDITEYSGSSIKGRFLLEDNVNLSRMGVHQQYSYQ